MLEGLETASRDADALKLEYLRDRARGVKTALPVKLPAEIAATGPAPRCREVVCQLADNLDAMHRTRRRLVSGMNAVTQVGHGADRRHCIAASLSFA